MSININDDKTKNDEKKTQSKAINITLYYAGWCGHCKDFMPTWHKMGDDKNAQKNIVFNEYEDIEIENINPEDKTINGMDVRGNGFPTIRIRFDDSDYIYQGRRTPENIYMSILDTLRE